MGLSSLSKLYFVTALTFLTSNMYADNFNKSIPSNINNSYSTREVSDSISKRKNDAPWPSIYNSIDSCFMENEKGISSFVLNKLNRNYLTPKYLNYVRLIDSLEHVNTWSFDANSFRLLENTINMNLMQNFKQLYYVANTSCDNIIPKFIPLKELVFSLDSINATESSQDERLRKIYNLSVKHMRTGKLSPSYVDLEQLTNGKLGDSNDLSLALYSILTYYRFNAGICLGNRVNKNNSLESYMWVGIKLGEKYINLDPTRYKLFVPLENRAKDIPCISFKGKRTIINK